MRHPTKQSHRKGDGLLPLSPELKGRLSINLALLVVVLLLGGEKFFILEEGVFMPDLGVPLEETFCTCPSDFRQSSSKDVSF